MANPGDDEEELVKLFVAAALTSDKKERLWIGGGETTGQYLDLVSETANAINFPRNNVIGVEETKQAALFKCIGSSNTWLDEYDHQFDANSTRKNMMNNIFSDSYLSLYGTGSSKPKDRKIVTIWDFENCRVPSDSLFPHISENIEHSLKGLGYSGSLDMVGIGNTKLFTENQRNILERQGIKLVHSEKEIEASKDTADKKSIVLVKEWLEMYSSSVHQVKEGSPVLLITSDIDFRGIVNHLQQQNFVVMIAHNGTAAKKFRESVPKCFLWQRIVEGKKI